MHRTELNAIVDRLLGYLENKNTAQASAAASMPPEVYLDGDRFERERSEIFRRQPLLACLSADLASPGDFVTREALGVQLLVCRDHDGQVRAFLNACRHRGVRVAEGCGQRRKQFACPYHGWTYNLRGELLSIFQEKTFGCIDQAQHGLRSLPCAEAAGMVFVGLDPARALDLDRHLGTLAPEMSGWHFEDLVASRKQIDLPCAANWKLTMETFCEIYHVSVVHRTSIPDNIGNVMTFDRFGAPGDQRHFRMAVPVKSIGALRELPASQWPAAPTPHVQFVYFIYPNVSLYVAGDTVGVSHVYPGESSDRSLIRLSGYARPGEGAEARADSMLAFLAKVLGTEDVHLTEEMHRGLATGLLPHVNFGRNEIGLHHIHECYERDLR